MIKLRTIKRNTNQTIGKAIDIITSMIVRSENAILTMFHHILPQKKENAMNNTVNTKLANAFEKSDI